jgi:hypothetical protein
MPRHIVQALLARSSRVATLGAVTLLAASSIGCGGGNSPQKMALTAPEAWKKMESEGSAMSFIGSVGDIATGNRSNTRMSEVATKGQADAEKRLEEAMSGDLPGIAIDAMVDEVAQILVKELALIPEVKAAPHQFVLAFGNIESGQNDATSRALDDLKTKLFENTQVTDSFFIVSASETDSNALVKKIAGGDLSSFRDPLQRTPDETKAQSFDPKLIYFINGKIVPSKEKAKRSISITMNWRVEKLIDRALVKNYNFKRTYMWHPYRNDWELQP